MWKIFRHKMDHQGVLTFNIEHWLYVFWIQSETLFGIEMFGNVCNRNVWNRSLATFQQNVDSEPF